MPNWFAYFLTLLMTAALIMGGSLCGCSHVHAMGSVEQTDSKATTHSETKTQAEPTGCGCAPSEDSGDDGSGCECGCDGFAAHDWQSGDLVEVAVASKNPLEDFKPPVLQPRFQALLAVWFADFIAPILASESEAIAAFIDPGPPGVDLPIYLRVQNLRL